MNQEKLVSSESEIKKAFCFSRFGAAALILAGSILPTQAAEAQQNDELIYHNISTLEDKEDSIDGSDGPLPTQFTVVREPYVAKQARVNSCQFINYGGFIPEPQKYKFQWLKDGKRIKSAEAKGSVYCYDKKEKGHYFTVKIKISSDGVEPMTFVVPAGRV